MPGISDHDGIPIILLSSLAANLGLSNKLFNTTQNLYMYHKADLQALKIDLIKWSDEFKLRNTSMNTVVK